MILRNVGFFRNHTALSLNSETRRVCIMDNIHILLICNFCSG
jgi:hypothetical protein